MPKKDYSYYPPALRPKSKKVEAEQRKQRQQVRSKARQAAARKESKAQSKWGNVKQAVQDVRSSDAVALGAMVLSRGKAGKGPKGGKTKYSKEGGRSTPMTRVLESGLRRESPAVQRQKGYAGSQSRFRAKGLESKLTKAKKGKTFKTKKSMGYVPTQKTRTTGGLKKPPANAATELREAKAKERWAVLEHRQKY